MKGTTVVHALNYGESLWGKTAKVIVRLPDGDMQNYFLKVGTTMAASLVSTARAVLKPCAGRDPWKYRTLHVRGRIRVFERNISSITRFRAQTFRLG